MSPKRPPSVVAELGRPETPEETADRKAQDSRNHRSRQTVNNLILSLLATLALVAIIFFMVPRANPDVNDHIDYAKVAAQAQGTEPDRLVAPKLPGGWNSNSAELRTKTSDGIDEWYIGLVTPDNQYIGITQGFNANPTWLADQVQNSEADGTKTIDGVTWTVYDNRQSSSDYGNVEYALTTQSGDSTFAVFGTASNAEFRTVARALATAIKSDAGGGTT